MTEQPASMAWLARKDGSVMIGYGPFHKTSRQPDQGVAFLVGDFAMERSHRWLIPARWEERSCADIPQASEASPAPACAWNPLEAGPFSEVFQEVTAALRGGVFEKTVPVAVETGVAASDPGPWILSSMARQPAPLCSYGYVEQGRGFAGATPELLFSLEGRRLETMALAGTARSEDREVFAVDEKEIREHEYVAQSLVAKLHDLGHLQRRERGILDLGSIVHFLTLIGVDLLAPQSPEAFVQRLHPTPALGPLPRTEQTLALLLQWRRKLGCPEEFGAPFGVWDRGRFDAVVAIRGIWWDGNELRLPAGCGVIAESRLVNEWRELRLKREAVKRFLQP